MDSEERGDLNSSLLFRHQPVMDMRDENFAGGDSGMGESGISDGVGE